MATDRERVGEEEISRERQNAGVLEYKKVAVPIKNR